MHKTRNKWLFVMCIMMVYAVGKPTLAYGASLVPNNIRVGLRSSYSNQSSIEIKNTSLNIGYGEDNRFRTEGTLVSNTGFVIKPSQKQYYRARDSFYTYDEAVSALEDYWEDEIDAIVVYSGPSTWSIYLEENLGDMTSVRGTGLEVMVQDGRGTDLLLCENNGLASAFVGADRSQSFDLTKLPKGDYRGWFEFVRKSNTITAVNIVDYEDYLYGVIPSEMPASWPMEALKAQAVAARSMSIHQYNKYTKDGYNVCDTIYTQVYKGFTGEKGTTNQAVDATRGIVATFNGKVAETLFYSIGNCETIILK